MSISVSVFDMKGATLRAVNGMDLLQVRHHQRLCDGEVVWRVERVLL
jgi:hypothetical protein